MGHLNWNQVLINNKIELKAWVTISTVDMSYNKKFIVVLLMSVFILIIHIHKNTYTIEE